MRRSRQVSEICALCAFRQSQRQNHVSLSAASKLFHTSTPRARSPTRRQGKDIEPRALRFLAEGRRGEREGRLRSSLLSPARRERDSSAGRPSLWESKEERGARFATLAKRGRTSFNPLGESDTLTPEGLKKQIATQNQLLHRLIIEQVTTLQSRLTHDNLHLSYGFSDKAQVHDATKRFLKKIGDEFEKARDVPPAQINPESLYSIFRRAFVEKSLKGLSGTIRFEFGEFMVGNAFSKEDVDAQKKVTDLRWPIEWYPETRKLQRTIHLHVGPTNSGKTYHALQRLEQAKSGIYAGPLRLLAHEVYTRLNAKGIQCQLVTGEERRIPEGMKHHMSSCTVEMVPLNEPVDVAVIDEIQMMSDPERGWAWTNAFLGVSAKEVHLCGEERMVSIIQELCVAMGDELVVHNYQRLSPLKPMKTSLGGDLSKLEKGDAIVVFSRVGIHAMKKQIEEATGRRCAVVYGSLPPETRAQQANLFNSEDNDYDFLVASDAIGMGLNLSIKRVIFEVTSKHDGNDFRTLLAPELKQIAGRAGRYRTAAQGAGDSKIVAAAATDSPADVEAAKQAALIEQPKSVGLVGSIDDFDLSIIRKTLATDVEPVTKVAIMPPDPIIHRFASYFAPTIAFSYVLRRLFSIATVGDRFFLSTLRDQLDVADIIQPYRLTVADRLIFCAAPVALRDGANVKALKAFARCVAEQQGGELLDIDAVNLEVLDAERDTFDKSYLDDLESLHKVITLYLWLSYRFAGVFRTQDVAIKVKDMVEQRINMCLERVDEKMEKRRERLMRSRSRAVKQYKMEQRRDAEEIHAMTMKGGVRRVDAWKDKASKAREELLGLIGGWERQRGKGGDDDLIEFDEVKKGRGSEVRG